MPPLFHTPFFCRDFSTAAAAAALLKVTPFDRKRAFFCAGQKLLGVTARKFRNGQNNSRREFLHPACVKFRRDSPVHRGGVSGGGGPKFVTLPFSSSFSCVYLRPRAKLLSSLLIPSPRPQHPHPPCVPKKRARLAPQPRSHRMTCESNSPEKLPPSFLERRRRRRRRRHL